jgi:hypothetical protein
MQHSKVKIHICTRASNGKTSSANINMRYVKGKLKQNYDMVKGSKTLHIHVLINTYVRTQNTGDIKYSYNFVAT